MEMVQELANTKNFSVRHFLVKLYADFSAVARHVVDMIKNIHFHFCLSVTEADESLCCSVLGSISLSDCCCRAP